MKIAERVRGRHLLLILSAAVTVAFIFLGVASFKAGSGHTWLLEAIPVWLVAEVFLIGSYFWEHSSRSVIEKNQSTRDRVRANWWLPCYVVACVVASSATRAFFPTGHEAIYNSGYWALLGASLLALFWFTVVSVSNVVLAYIARRVIAMLLLLIGIASGPLIVMLANDHGMVPPVVVIVGIAWITPVLLWGWRLYPFKPHSTPV